MEHCTHLTCAHSRLHLAGILALILMLAPGMVLGQQREDPQGALPPQAEGQRREGNQAQQRPQAQGGVFRRMRELPPYEQRRFMATDPEFLSFGPMRQDLIRQHLRQWNNMTPEEKDRVRQREEIFASLSPNQRQEARLLFPQWRGLPPERRQAVMVAFRHLRDMPPTQRHAYLDSREVMENFSPHERDILGGLSNLLPESRGSQPNDPDE
jgi:hypothetical protein